MWGQIFNNGIGFLIICQLEEVKEIRWLINFRNVGIKFSFKKILEDLNVLLNMVVLGLSFFLIYIYSFVVKIYK